MSYNPYGGRYTYGGSLKHYRTPGSKNGYRKDGSKPTGNPAVGKIVGYKDGHPVYSYFDATSPANKMSVAKRNMNANKLAKAVGQEHSGNGNLKRKMRQRDFNMPVEKAGKAVRNAGSSIGNWLKERRRDVTNWFNQAGDNLRNGTVKRSVKGWFDQAGDNIRKAGKTAYEAISNSDERKRMEEAKANYEKAKGGKHEAAAYRDYKKAQKAYDSHLLTKLGRAPKNAYEAVSNADERERMNAAKAEYEASKGTVDEYRKQKTYEKAKNEYDRHLLTRAGRGAQKALKDTTKFAKTTSGKVKRGAEQTWEYVKPGGTLDRKVVEAAKNVESAVTNVGKQAWNKTSEAARNVGESVTGYVNQKQIDRDYKSAQREYDKLQAQVDAARTPNERERAIQKRDTYYDETFKSIETAYKNSHRKK